MALTLLISSQEVKDLQGLNKNIEDRKLSRWIVPAQMALRSAIGKDGYDAIVAEAAAPDADYEALIEDYVKPYLAAQVERMSPIPLTAESDRNGSFEREGDTYRPVSHKTLGLMNASARDMAEILRDVMLRYIYDERAVFTWYNASCRTNYSNGVITRTDRSQYNEDPYPLDGYPNECCDGSN